MLSRDGHSYSPLDVSSPSFFMSPPALASTPSVPSNNNNSNSNNQLIQFRIPRTPSDSLLDGSVREEDVQSSTASSKPSSTATNSIKVEFMDLPSLALDRVFIYLSDQDLRAVHQVSKKWRDTLESQERRGDNARRIALVQKIREDKENILSKAKGLECRVRKSRNRPVSFSKDAKGGVLLLTDCTNLSSSSTPDIYTTNSKHVQLTPISSLPFQMFAEKEKRLSRGQVLFQCRRCRGPVPSPILSCQSPVVANSSKIESTKCRLITRMDFTPTPTTTVTPQRKKVAPERKKSKNVPAIDTPTTIALSDIMSQSLVISGAGNKSVNLQSNKSGHTSTKPEALFSPITIDLSLNTNNSQDSSIDCHLDVSNILRDSSFGILKLPSYFPSPISSSPCLNVTPEVTPSDSLLGDSVTSPLNNLIVSPTQDSPTVNSTSSSSRQTKTTTLALHSKDFIKPKTLKKNSRIPQSPLCGNNNDINFVLSNATKNARNNSLSTSNSKLNTSLIVSGDKERRLLSTNIVTDVSRSPKSHPSSLAVEAGKNDQLATSSNNSVNTSDYYSHGSILRHEIDSRSYIPETFSRFVDLATSNTEGSFSSSDFKLRSQSLGNMADSMDEKFSSFESFSSCPNLSSSFVLECPNPHCSFRFCSACLDTEHPGRACRLISSDSVEELHQTSICSTKLLISSADASKGKGKGKPVAKTSNKGRDKLRRLAKLS